MLLGSIHAQTGAVQSGSDSVVAICADAAGLAPAVASSRGGTWWVVSVGFNGHLQMVPYPSLPPDLLNLPKYTVAPNIFVVDNTGGQIMPRSAKRMSSAAAAATVQAQAQDLSGLIALIQFPTNGDNPPFQPNGLPPTLFTNGMWLSFSNEPPYPIGSNLWWRLHGTIDGDAYQLLSANDLTSTNWDLGEILWDAYDDYTDFMPVPMTNAMAFYRAHHANPVMQLWNIQDAVERNPTNSTGQVGFIGIQNGDQAHGLMTNGVIISTNDVTVYYSVSGTAQGGIDYSNLPGVLTIPAGLWSTNIVIEPIANGLKPDQTIILTLVQNTNYLIDTDYASTTNTLFANPNVFPTAHGDKQWPCPNRDSTILLQGYDPNNWPLAYSIVTWPTNGTLDTSALPWVTYTATNCWTKPLRGGGMGLSGFA